MFVHSKLVFGFVVYLFIYIDETASELERNPKPAEEFSEYTIARPTLYHGRTKRAINATNSTEGEHHQKVTVELDIDGEPLALDLELNRDLLPRKYVVSYQKDGKTSQSNPTPKELNICQYYGEVRGKPGSWAALSTCQGVRGLFYDGNKLRYIEPEGPTASSLHFIYDHSNLVYGNTSEPLQSAYTKYTGNKITRDTRYADAPREPYNGNPRSSYIELVVVVDNGLYRKRHGNLQVIYDEVKDLVNVINFMFSPLNIFVTLAGVKVWSEGDEIHIKTNHMETLDAFLKYRFENLLSEMPNDHAVLLTDITFLDNVVGKAYVNKMCTREHSGSVASWHSDVLGLMAATIAHEIGHNLAMEHDSEDCKCEGTTCVMSSTIESTVPLIWSDCSMTSLAIGLQKGGNYCLRNIPDRLFGSPKCGNGFVESGEQCDCGVGEGRHGACEACCHPDTCLLRSNATCATGSCCDLQTCQIQPIAKLCRAAVGECDLPEYCTGESEFCPDNVYKMDTTPCARNEAYCAHGKCRSHNSQCILIWGQSAANGDSLCYKTNSKEVSVRGDCGFDYLKKTYSPCEEENAVCGRLQCRQYSGEIGFGSWVESSNYLITLKDRTCSCSTAVIDTGTDDDPGLVPDGAMCGKDKICMGQKCLDVAYVRKRMMNKNSMCHSDCSGHGVCNSEGNCHCDAGYAPPSCDAPGTGGSVDSGPQSDPQVLKNFMVAMYAIFLGILPLVIFILLLICCLKRRKQSSFDNDLMNGFKLQNCTVADFRLFSHVSKSCEKKESQSQNVPKPRLRKEDIEVISDFDQTSNVNPKTCVKTQTIIRDKKNEQKIHSVNSERVNSSVDHVNVNFKKQIRSPYLDESTYQKNKSKPKINKALMSKHEEAKISHNNIHKISMESTDVLKDCTVESNVQKMRKMFDRTE